MFRVKVSHYDVWCIWIRYRFHTLIASNYRFTREIGWLNESKLNEFRLKSMVINICIAYIVQHMRHDMHTIQTAQNTWNQLYLPHWFGINISFGCYHLLHLIYIIYCVEFERNLQRCVLCIIIHHRTIKMSHKLDKLFNW